MFSRQPLLNITPVVFVSATLAFLLDAIVGGNLLIPLFIPFFGPPNLAFSPLFFVLGLGNALAGLVLAMVLERHLKGRQYVFITPLATFLTTMVLATFMFVGGVKATLLSNFMVGLVFSFTSGGAFVLLSMFLFKELVPEDRGKVLGLAVAFSLVLSGILVLVPDLGVELSAVLLLIGALVAVVVVWQKPPKFSLLTIDEEGTLANDDILEWKNLRFILPLVVALMAFLGSGMAHTAVLNIPALGDALGTQEYRAYGFVVSGFVLLLLGLLSDIYGRLIILVYAVAISLLSQFMGFLSVLPELAVILEVGGYYGILCFLALQVADSATASKAPFLISGVWGVGLFANYFASVVASELLMTYGIEVAFLSGLSLTLFLIAVILMMVYPLSLRDPPVVSDVVVLNRTGQVIGSWSKVEGRDPRMISLLVAGIVTFAEREMGGGEVEGLRMRDSVCLIAPGRDTIAAILVDKETYQLHTKAQEFLGALETSLTTEELSTPTAAVQQTIVEKITATFH